MKNVIFILGLFICAGCGSGSNGDADLPKEPETEGKKITVSFKLSGELTDGGENVPLLRSGAESSNLYGIQVYAYSDGSKQYEPYMSGVFDKLDNLSFSVIEGGKYKIRATAIIDGKNVVKKTDSYYYYPFAGVLANLFADSKAEMSGLRASYTDCALDGKGYELPVADRYYGEVSDVVFDETNNYVTVSMKRVVFAVMYKVRNLKQGSLLVSLSDDKKTSPVFELSADKQFIYTFSNMAQAWEAWQSGYSYEYTVKVEYKAPDNTIQLIGTKKMKVERRKITSLTINMSAEPSFDLDFEEGELEKGEDVIL